jgi:hypothetical protein
MLKRGHRAILLALVSLSLLWAPSSYAAGTIPFSMTQQLDRYGVPLSGCLLYTIQAGTTSTPQNAYKDTALSLVQPNPMVCDSSGRLPQFFLADGQIKIRLLDKLGNPQVVLDNILVIGPSSGGGSGATIDPTTIAATGDLKEAYGTQVITGWVRFNGRTIGNATSGATERANADTQALFLYLWAADPNLTVSGGRTTAAADYAANKTITLPDGAGRALAGLDDMGAGPKGRLTATYFGTAATVLGAAGGSQTGSLTSVNQMPPYTPGGINNSGASAVPGTPVNITVGSGSQAWFDTIAGTAALTTQPIFAGTPVGASAPFAVASPMLLVTIYIKL